MDGFPVVVTMQRGREKKKINRKRWAEFGEAGRHACKHVASQSLRTPHLGPHTTRLKGEEDVTPQCKHILWYPLNKALHRAEVLEQETQENLADVKCVHYMIHFTADFHRISSLIFFFKAKPTILRTTISCSSYNCVAKERERVWQCTRE